MDCKVRYKKLSWLHQNNMSSLIKPFQLIHVSVEQCPWSMRLSSSYRSAQKETQMWESLVFNKDHLRETPQWCLLSNCLSIWWSYWRMLGYVYVDSQEYYWRNLWDGRSSSGFKDTKGFMRFYKHMRGWCRISKHRTMINDVVMCGDVCIM